MNNYTGMGAGTGNHYNQVARQMQAYFNRPSVHRRQPTPFMQRPVPSPPPLGMLRGMPFSGQEVVIPRSAGQYGGRPRNVLQNPYDTVFEQQILPLLRRGVPVSREI